MRLSSLRVCIVGLGLMGGSLAAALKGSCDFLIGYDRDPATRNQAGRLGLCNSVAPDLSSALQNTDLLLLAVPVRSILSILSQIGNMLPQPALVMDIGSTKAVVLTAMEKLPAGVDAIGGHPMCGKEVSGIAAVDAELYRGCRFVLCPLERTRPESLELARELISLLEAVPLVMDSAQHDRLVALTSHLPYLLASILVQTASSQAGTQAVWDLAAGGFRDTSRVAASNLAMMIDILLTNQRPILDALSTSQALLQDLSEAILQKDEEELHAILEPARQIRASLILPPAEEKEA
ncbi:MAG: prephenate dehydrogenase [Anaerolineales bacterium]|nr:prephenate dehydrogenase [Anaerolineales bacterium]